MKIIDSKGKLFGLINILDLAILLILVASAFIFYNAATQLHDFKYDENKMFKIEVLCQGISLERADVIKVGDLELRRARIIDIERADTRPLIFADQVVKLYTSEDGQKRPLIFSDQVVKLYESKDGQILDRRVVSYMIITFRVKGYIKNGAIYDQSQHVMKVGESFKFATKFYDISGTIISIEESGS